MAKKKNIFPDIPSSGAKWGFVQTVFAIAVLLIGIPSIIYTLLFSFNDGGGSMNIGIAIACYICFGIGVILLLYIMALGIYWYKKSKNEVDNYATKDEIKALTCKLDELIKEIQQDKK